MKYLWIALLLVVSASCSNGPEPIAYGKDVCAYCRMTIVDQKFGAEVLTRKGRNYKFDDLHCLAAFDKEGTVPAADRAQVLFIDYETPHGFIDAKKAVLLQGGTLHSPMNGNIAAFATEAAAEAASKITEAHRTQWTGILPNQTQR